jgi:hypothetical protein
MKHPVLLHVREHTWLWVAGLAVLGTLLGVLGLSTPAALSFMAVGLLVMLKSQGTDILAIVSEDPLGGGDDADASTPEATERRTAEPVR